MAAVFPNPDRLYYGDYSESGVDLSLLRENLKLTPLERLIRMEEHARNTKLLLEYGRKHREANAAKGR
jgi:hypothetical protein